MSDELAAAPLASSHRRPRRSSSVRRRWSHAFPPCAISVVHRAAPDEATVLVSGELDLVTAPLLADCLTSDDLYRCRRVTVDMSDVSFLGGSGLSVLMKAGKRLGLEHGVLIIRHPQRLVRRILGLVGLDRLDSVQVVEPEEASGDS